MNIILVVQLICMVLTLMLGPMIFTQLIRAVVHDRGYNAGYLDLVLACGIAGLVVLGVNPWLN